MHTRDFEYTENDLKYADDDVKPYVYIHHNGDFSGEVIISKVKYNTGYYDNPTEEIKIPSWMLIDLVGEYFAGELTQKVEQMSGGDFLKLLCVPE